jgi:hypothetical protein
MKIDVKIDVSGKRKLSSSRAELVTPLQRWKDRRKRLPETTALESSE